MKMRKLLALLLTVIMITSVTAPALANDISASQEQTQTYTYQAPTSPMTVDENIITASAHRAASPILGMLGVNAVSGFGMINGGAPEDFEAAQSSAALGVWGSSLNENPDPYYWNYFYNYYADANGLALSEDALLNTNAAASPVGADTTLVPEYGNVSISLYTRPDILVGCASSNSGADVDGYNDQLATIHGFTSSSPYYQAGDETYAPKLVSYQTTTIKDMIWSVHQLADAISEVETETGKTTRYGDVQQIADDYENYIYGIIAYVKEELAANGLTEKTAAVITAINDDGTYTIGDALSTSATSLLRAFEYSESVTKNLADTYGTTVTLDQLLTADVIITINNNNINKNTLEESFGDKTYDGIMITNTPATLYGLTMNSVENAMGFAYVIGSMYSDVIDIDPVELCAYFYQHFLHISDLDSLATVVKTNFANTILPDGVSATLQADYSAAKIERMLATGLAYYNANLTKFAGTEYTRLGMGIRYADVAKTSTFYDAIEYVSDEGLFTGTTATTFSPSVVMSRQMLMTVLARLDGADTTGSPYAKGMAWAVENGISDGSNPTSAVSRQQMVTMLWRYAGEPDSTYSLSGYSDTAAISSYAETAMAWAVENGIVSGYSDGTLRPTTGANRGQVAAILMRFCENLSK